MSRLVEQLKEQQKQAMRAKDKARLGTIRLVMAEIKQREVDGQKTLNDEEVLTVLTKMVKQRKDSVQQYEAAARQDLADAEKAEIKVLEEFMPQPLTDAEVAELIEQAMTETGASSMADMGKVMGWLKPKLQGRADMGAASGKIRARLNA